ncbi:MAG: DUF177 domain-containing protein [Mariprofundaceae bacterium]
MDLTIKLQDLPRSGRQWCLDVSRDLLADQSVGEVDVIACLCTDVHWQGSICRHDKIYILNGEWNTAMERNCSRCTADFEHQIQSESHREFCLEAVEVLKDEEKTYDELPLPGLINLVDVLREDIWLNWQSIVICHKDCKGLCQKCGENLNQGACLCPQQGDDHPFAVLKSFRFDA